MVLPVTLATVPARAIARTTTARMVRDDTAEIVRLMALLPKAKRLAVPLPDDVAELYGLIDRMKKKAA